MQKLFVKQQMFKWRDTFCIYDAKGVPRYFCVC